MAERQSGDSTKHSLTLTISSLILIVLMTFHFADDIVRGYEAGGVSNFVIFPICALLLYGTLALRERKPGYAIILLGSLFSLAVPYFHMKGKGLAAQVARIPSGGFLFVWTILALGTLGLFSVVLSLQLLLRRSR